MTGSQRKNTGNEYIMEKGGKNPKGRNDEGNC